ncbi:hypothetical protein B0O80DRAFT_484557 [Mortierella sp. GBAus27b]|nr:hypothetical protein B0O80DRAFT_484557 [Mortierella sp. GBAus27b]
MPLHSMTTFLSFTYILTSFFFVHSIPSAHAQQYQPTPVYGACTNVVEGQGLYVIGGKPDMGDTAQSGTQAFMIDLSVSWDTSRPAFKKLNEGPGGFLLPCTMLANGKEMFMLALGIGYTYDLKSDSWTRVTDIDFPIGIRVPAGGYGGAAVTDPESGLIYIANGPNNASDGSKGATGELDLKARKIKMTPMPALNATGFNSAVWSAPMRSMLFMSAFENALYLFTPGEMNGPSHGWKSLKNNGPSNGAVFPCFVPAYGGSKVVLSTPEGIFNSIHILDVATMTWKRGPNCPNCPQTSASSCGVSGDQLIVWGGGSNMYGVSSKTYVYNMKLEKWVTSYTAPAPQSATPTSAITAIDDTNPNDTKYIIIIVVSTVVLLLVILTSAFLCLRRAKRFYAGGQRKIGDHPESSSLDSNSDTYTHGKGFSTTSYRRDPSGFDLASTGTLVDHSLISPSKELESSNRLYQDLYIRDSPPSHPHAIAREVAPERSVQGPAQP